MELCCNISRMCKLKGSKNQIIVFVLTAYFWDMIAVVARRPFICLMAVLTAYLANITHIPDVETVIIVDHGHSSILFIIGHRTGIGVLCVVGVGGHVGDGQPLGHVHPQVVSPGQGGDELQGLGGETADNPLGTANEDKLLSHRQTIGTETETI